MRILERFLDRRSRQREALERKYGVRFSADHDPERDSLFEGRSYTQRDIWHLERAILNRRSRRRR